MHKCILVRSRCAHGPCAPQTRLSLIHVGDIHNDNDLAEPSNFDQNSIMYGFKYLGSKVWQPITVKHVSRKKKESNVNANASGDVAVDPSDAPTPELKENSQAVERTASVALKAAEQRASVTLKGAEQRAAVALKEAELARQEAKSAWTEAEIAWGRAQHLWGKSELAMFKAELALNEIRLAQLSAEAENTKDASQLDKILRGVVRHNDGVEERVASLSSCNGSVKSALPLQGVGAMIFFEISTSHKPSVG